MHEIITKPNSLFDQDVTKDQLKNILDLISTEGVVSEDRFCFLHGHGSHTRDEIWAVGEIDGVDLIWTGPCLPWYLYPLSFIAACQGGLFSLNKPGAIKQSALLLSDLAYVNFYSVDSGLRNEIVNYIKKKKWKAFPERLLLSKDPTFFQLGVDGDSSNSDTGIFAYCRCGPNAPKALVQRLNKFMNENFQTLNAEKCNGKVEG